MFLATTALSEFWDREQQILFLGRWCLRQDRRTDWEGLRYEVMENPWNDREAFHAGAEYLDEFCERTLLGLTDYLGGVHQEKRSVRFWRILLGPWLMIAAHTTFDRFVCLQKAKRQGEFETKGLHRSNFAVPTTTLDHLHSILDDRANLQVFTQLLEQMGHVVVRLQPETSDREVESVPTTSPLTNARLRIKQRITRAASIALGQFCRIALVDIHAKVADEWRLSLRSGFRALPLSVDGQTVNVPPQWDEKRLDLAAMPARTEFERSFSALLPSLLPTAFLEGYHLLENAARSLPRGIEAIISAVGWNADEGTKYALADLADRGKKIFALQHGAGYGQFRSAPAELHEKRLADRYLVWGWADQAADKLRNVPDMRLSRLAGRRRAPDRYSTILFVATNHPRYLYRFHSCPVAGQWEEYFDWQCRFFNSLGHELCGRSTYKPYPIDYGNCLGKRLLAAFPVLNRPEQPGHSIATSRIVVVDHCGTTMLEALAADAPTVLFWDPERWEIRTAAADDFNALRDAGILYSTPESAATHIHSVYEHPLQWWRSASVREALRRFVSRQALTSRRWSSEWLRTLTRELPRPPA